MAEDNFKTYLFAFILMSLFGMLILTSVTQIGNTYSKDTSEISGGSLSLQKFNDSIKDIESDAKDLKARFDKQSVWSTIAGVVVEGIFGIAKDMIIMIFLPFDLMNNILIDVLHVPAFVGAVLLGLLILGIIFGIWRLLKIGD